MMPTPSSPPAVDPIPPALVVLAAGLSTRYGRLKQLDPVGPAGEAMMEYAIRDAVEAGVGRVVIVVRGEIERQVAKHVARAVAHGRLPARVDLVTAVQRPEDLPGCREVPTGRRRPWGTAHAIHAARGPLEGVPAFVVVNADDGYGRDAIRRVVRWAIDAPRDEFALVPYRLGSTLSTHGGVSRGVLDVDATGMLSGIREAVGLRADPRTEGRVTGRWSTGGELGGTPADLDASTPVSMNLWGFTSGMIDRVRQGIEPFLVRTRGDREAEYLLPDVVREAIGRGEIRTRVLDAATFYIGMTHPEDREDVVAALATDVRWAR